MKLSEITGGKQRIKLSSLNQEPYIKKEIAKTEPLLQSVVKDLPAIGAGLTFPLPQMFRELTRSPIAGPAEYGQRLATGTLPDPAFDIPEPQTTLGKVAPFIPIGIGAVKGGMSLGKAGIGALFGKQIAKKALPEASSALSKSIQEVIKRSASDYRPSIPRTEILEVLEKGLASSTLQKGPQATLFKDWIKKLSNHPDDFVNANIIEEIETSFGHVAKFGKDPGANPRLVKAAKEVNRYASGKFDEMANKLGVPEFVKNSANKSKLLKEISSKDGFGKKILKRAVSGAATVAGGKAAWDLISD